MATTSSLPVGTILQTVWDDLGELSVRLRSQSLQKFLEICLGQYVPFRLLLMCHTYISAR